MREGHHSTIVGLMKSFLFRRVSAKWIHLTCGVSVALRLGLEINGALEDLCFMFLVSNRGENYKLGGTVWASVTYCLGICLEGLKKAAENFSHDSWPVPGIKPMTSHI